MTPHKAVLKTPTLETTTSIGQIVFRNLKDEAQTDRIAITYARLMLRDVIQLAISESETTGTNGIPVTCGQILSAAMRHMAVIDAWTQRCEISYAHCKARAVYEQLAAFWSKPGHLDVLQNDDQDMITGLISLPTARFMDLTLSPSSPLSPQDRIDDRLKQAARRTNLPELEIEILKSLLADWNKFLVERLEVADRRFSDDSLGDLTAWPFAPEIRAELIKSYAAECPDVSAHQKTRADLHKAVMFLCRHFEIPLEDMVAARKKATSLGTNNPGALRESIQVFCVHTEREQELRTEFPETWKSQAKTFFLLP